jgi:hypothetical protein
MIDYEKLKICYELADKLSKPAILTISVTHGDIGRVYGVLQYDYSLFDAKYMGEFKFTCIESLTEKLQSLVRPEPKYKCHDTVWFMDKGQIQKGIIDDINVFNNCHIYHVSSDGEGFMMGELKLFLTRQDLILALIEYWKSLLDAPIIDERTIQPFKTCCKNCNEPWSSCDCNQPGKRKSCDHMLDPDNRICMKCHEYVPKVKCEHQHDGMIYTSNPPQNKCVKCGEFYK